MNTRRVFALVIGTCVAVLSISGCSAQSPEPKTGSELPAINENIPKGYDRWEKMNGGPADIPEMAAMAEMYGLNGINLPTKAYVGDYIGVSQLESYCVVGFHTTLDGAEVGLMDLVVMSRFNKSYFIGMPSLPPENVLPMIDKYRPLCSGDKPLSEYTDGPDTEANA